MKRLDFSAINFSDEPFDVDNYINHLKPLDIPQEVLNGEKQIVLKNGVKDYKNKCVKLETSYL